MVKLMFLYESRDMNRVKITNLLLGGLLLLTACTAPTKLNVYPDIRTNTPGVIQETTAISLQQSSTPSWIPSRTPHPTVVKASNIPDDYLTNTPTPTLTKTASATATLVIPPKEDLTSFPTPLPGSPVTRMCLTYPDTLALGLDLSNTLVMTSWYLNHSIEEWYLLNFDQSQVQQIHMEQVKYDKMMVSEKSRQAENGGTILRQPTMKRGANYT